MSGYTYTGPYRTYDLSTAGLGRLRMVAEPTLGLAQELYMLAAEQARRIESIDEGEPDEQEVNLRRAEVVVLQMRACRLILDPRHHEEVKGWTWEQLKDCVNLWPARVPEEVPPVGRFHFPPAYLHRDHANRGVLRRFLKGNTNDTGWFRVLPVPEMPLRAKAVADKTREAIPAKPTAQQIIDTAKADAAMRVWQAEARNGHYAHLHVLISHISVPEGKEYDEAAANERAESFKHLPLFIASGVASLFLRALATSKPSSPTS